MKRRQFCSSMITAGAFLPVFNGYALAATRATDSIPAISLDGAEIDPEGQVREERFVSETGIKFRANLSHSPLGFATKIGIDFWGLRLGIRYTRCLSFCVTHR